MNHLKWLEHSPTMLGIQRTLLSELGTCDIKISSQGKTVAAHRFVLSAASDFFKRILHDLPRNEEATIILPDTKQHILDNLISFIYTGETCLTSQYLSDFLDCTHFLGIKSAINFEVYDSTTNGPKRGTFVVGSAFATTITPTASQQIIPTTECVVIEDDDDDPIDQRQYEDLEVYNTTETDKLGFTISDIQNTTTTFTESGGQYNPIQLMVVAPEPNTQSVTVTTEETYATTTPILPKIQTVQTLAQSPMVAIPTTAFVTKKQKKPKGPKVIDVRHTASLDFSDTSIESDMNSDPIEMETSKGDLEAALKEVVSVGLTLQKAAEKYNIAKSVLWRQAKEHPNYTKIQKESFITEYTCENLKAGQTMKQISQDLDIPLSIIYRRKVRLSKEGRLPVNIATKTGGVICQRAFRENMSKAIAACKSGMPQSHASVVFNINKSTLSRHLRIRGLLNLHKNRGSQRDDRVDLMKPDLGDLDYDDEFAKHDLSDLDDDVVEMIENEPNNTI